jgi:hypothetical protein
LRRWFRDLGGWFRDLVMWWRWLWGFDLRMIGWLNVIHFKWFWICEI